MGRRNRTRAAVVVTAALLAWCGCHGFWRMRPPARVVRREALRAAHADGVPDRDQRCERNADCVPVPGCHPAACLSRAGLRRTMSEALARGENPQAVACEEYLDVRAAYGAQDCACVSRICVNMNGPYGARGY